MFALKIFYQLGISKTYILFETLLVVYGVRCEAILCQDSARIVHTT